MVLVTCGGDGALAAFRVGHRITVPARPVAEVGTGGGANPPWRSDMIG
jgi:hypothetical protein